MGEPPGLLFLDLSCAMDWSGRPAEQILRADENAWNVSCDQGCLHSKNRVVFTFYSPRPHHAWQSNGRVFTVHFLPQLMYKPGDHVTISLTIEQKSPGSAIQLLLTYCEIVAITGIPNIARWGFFSTNLWLNNEQVLVGKGALMS
ncbi:hypothetical protein AB1N83_001232 [Pleurotus pulmonarius]